MRTYSTRASDIERKWHVVDASGKVLGRLTTEVANVLMGKHKPKFVRNLDMGDSVIVINADKVRTTGKKAEQKIYYRHSQYLGGLKSVSLEEVMQTNPSRAIEHAVKGMLPQNRLRDRMLGRLRIYTSDKQPNLKGLIIAAPVEVASKEG